MSVVKDILWHFILFSLNGIVYMYISIDKPTHIFFHPYRVIIECKIFVDKSILANIRVSFPNIIQLIFCNFFNFFFFGDG